MSLATVPNNANQYLPGVVQIPSSLQIIAISRSFPAFITVANDPVTEFNTYQPRQLVRLNIPNPFGMQQANSLQVQVLSNTGNQIVVMLDTRNFDPFVVPSGNVTQPATIAPAGSQNLEYDNTTRQVPFQSLNNRGN